MRPPLRARTKNSTASPQATDRARQARLQYLLTEFAVSIGFKADKTRYNRAWHKLWVNIHRLGLFTSKHPCLKVHR